MRLPRLYLSYAAASLRSQMQYPASFLMQSLGNLIASGMDIVGIWALFTRFGTLRGWTLPEVALFYGLVQVAFALAEAFGRGFDTFDRLVKNGGFDRLLVRPRPLWFQVAANDVQMMRVGRFLQGGAVLTWALARLEVALTPLRLLQALGAVAGGVALFVGLFVLQATMAFWTTESLEVMNTVTYGGAETGQYPLPIYRRWFRRFFTVVVPLACVTYYPGMGVLGRAHELGRLGVLWSWLAPAAGVAFLAAALGLWHVGVRHYRSTGS
jgi:ABC-2 type transport system permease protein